MHEQLVGFFRQARSHIGEGERGGVRDFANGKRRVRMGFNSYHNGAWPWGYCRIESHLSGIQILDEPRLKFDLGSVKAWTAERLWSFLPIFFGFPACQKHKLLGSMSATSLNRLFFGGIDNFHNVLLPLPGVFTDFLSATVRLFNKCVALLQCSISVWGCAVMDRSLSWAKWKRIFAIKLDMMRQLKTASQKASRRKGFLSREN